MGLVDSNLLKVHASRAVLIAMSFVQPREGLYLKSYPDPPGIATACWGHTSGVKLGQIYTKSQCVIFLSEDMRRAEIIFKDETTDIARREVSQQTEAAYLSFIFNTGAGTFETSSVRRDLNAGRIESSCDDLAACVLNKKNGKYVGFGCGWAGNQRLPGLESRREAEKELCLGGIK